MPADPAFTKAERDALICAESHRRRMGWVLTTNRVIRKATVLRLVERGLFRVVQCVRCDGDGFAKQPERWTDGSITESSLPVPTGRGWRKKLIEAVKAKIEEVTRG